MARVPLVGVDTTVRTVGATTGFLREGELGYRVWGVEGYILELVGQQCS